jgi:hypothetical protein
MHGQPTREAKCRPEKTRACLWADPSVAGRVPPILRAAGPVWKGDFDVSTARTAATQASAPQSAANLEKVRRRPCLAEGRSQCRHRNRLIQHARCWEIVCTLLTFGLSPSAIRRPEGRLMLPCTNSSSARVGPSWSGMPEVPGQHRTAQRRFQDTSIARRSIGRFRAGCGWKRCQPDGKFLAELGASHHF